MLKNTTEFLRGRQIALHDLRILFGPPELLKLYIVCQIYPSIRLHNDDDNKDFDTWLDHGLLAASELPTETALEGFYKSKLKGFLFSFTVYWLCMNKKTFEMTNLQTTPD